MELSLAEKSVLSKGLSFIPLRPRSDLTTTKIDIEKFFRRLRLKAHFYGAPPSLPDNGPFHKFSHMLSTWTPPAGQYPALDRFIQSCGEAIGNLRPKLVRQSNMSKDERAALLKLKTRSDIVIKPADKGGAVVVWRKDLYSQEAHRQLNDDNLYEKIPTDSTPDTHAQIKRDIQSCIASSELPGAAVTLCVPEARTSQFYLLPKIHKLNCPGRPIVSACSCPTEHLSSFLHDILSPLNKALPTYIKDTSHALEIFGDFTFGDESSKLIFTMDIQALYTSIPHGDGLIALKHFLDSRQDESPPTHTLLRLAELVLTLNTFEFCGSHYKQVQGVAMGTKMGPTYACLFVGFLEKQIFQQYTGTTPDLYKRYIDDVGGAASCSKEELQQFIDFVDSFHPAIRYTATISSTQLPLLDIMLSISGNRIATSVFYKETDAHCYLKYQSSHPTSTKDSIPYSQLLRLRRLCSDESDFIQQADQMSLFFERRGYPSSVITEAREKVTAISRRDAMVPVVSNNTNRIPLVLTYHPHNTRVKNIIYTHWNILTRDEETNAIFHEKPLCAFRRDKNLRDQLVRARLNRDPNSSGTFQCGRRRCSTCPFISNMSMLHGPSGSHRILDGISCTTRSVIYAILCQSCNSIYIGQTGQRLADRFAQHLRSIRTQDGQPVARHFVAHGHPVNESNIKLCGLAWYRGSAAGRMNLETRLILKLGTLAPGGMNTRNDIRI